MNTPKTPPPFGTPLPRENPPKYRENFCPSRDNTGVISLRYQLHLLSVFVFKRRGSSGYENYFMASSLAGIKKKTVQQCTRTWQAAVSHTNPATARERGSCGVQGQDKKARRSDYSGTEEIPSHVHNCSPQDPI